MTEWIYFLHPPRENFVSTITEDEAALMSGPHSGYITDLLAKGTLVLAGPSIGSDGGLDDGIAIFEADDEAAARAIMEADPAIASGLMRGELRPMRVAFLRGRDG